MGNSTSSSSRNHHDETVDYGYLTPRGVYTGPRDWNQAVVSQLICQRKLAPFYRPLEDFNDSWDDDQILAARKSLPDGESETVTRTEAPATPNSTKPSNKRPGALKEPSKPEAAIYRGAVECPICFLYYPPNINYSRCCDQAICTECFVQIKRNEPTTTHLVSEPAACPYCVQENFGVIYAPPPWRAGIGGEGMSAEVSRWPQLSTDATHKRRRKSFSAESPEVVTTDQIRPDWEAKLAAVRAAVARRANRRIIMRQVGDRLIPVGVTSGRVQPLGQEESSSDSSENGGSRRRRRQQGHGFEQFLGMSGQDLEELMMMEAMRLSLIDHEEQQRKEAAERKKTEAAAAATESSSEATSVVPSPAGPGPSTLAARSNLSTHDSSESSSGTSVSPSSSHPSTECSAMNSINRNNRTPPDGAGVISTDGSSWHLHRPSPAPSSTPSTASAILTNESEGHAPGALAGFPSENTATSEQTSPQTFESMDSPAYDPLPSSPNSPSEREPLLHPSMDSQIFRKVKHASENGPDLTS
ncbi:hypothetical protein M378DRAFT_158446 [Amanita muscaria Koide BX008]|uniref:RING-type domain-containing protein n=1 Tax=Amanita muscaria (strain Koide BX008) TaxID=946122 RepID=A0A0C2X393_AMAMK|nr:hypothetical protein M378DRAFT_158446 [Amanita muscaria Koide BX008]